MKRDALFLFAVAGASIALGTIYSVYNTDSHHWGFIAGTAIDFIRGKSLYSEIYIQYGAGQAILFRLLSYFGLTVNYTNVGIVTSAVYALIFPVTYACVRRITHRTHAVLVTTMVFLIHPFPIYPWPDYFAGFCVLLSCYLLVTARKGHGHWPYVGVGATLFLAFLFRNTYLVNIGCAIGVVAGLSIFVRKLRSKAQVTTSGTFAGLLIAYFSFLAYQENLSNWYGQNFGAATSQYGAGLQSVVKLTTGLVAPNDVLYSVFLGLLLVNAFVIVYVLVRGDKRPELTERADCWKLVFIGVLGSAGISQGLVLLEVFRLQNGCVPLWVGLAYFLRLIVSGKAPDRNHRYLSIGFAFVFLILVSQVPKVLVGSPHGSTIWPIIALPIGSSYKTFVASDIAYFRFHRFQDAETRYYDDLSRHVCDGTRRVVNLTRDSTVPYLCSVQENALGLPFYDDALLRRISEPDAERIRAGDFRSNEVVVSDFSLPSKAGTSLRLIGTTERPASIPWMYPGTVSVFHVE